MNIEEKIKALYEEMNAIQKRIEEEYLLNSKSKKIDELTYQLYRLKASITSLTEESYLERTPTICGDTLDLYLKNIMEASEAIPDRYQYIITLHDTKIKVGEIDIRFRISKESCLGNIGCQIQKEYRGNRYAKKAFTMLRDVMLENGLRKPILTVDKENLSSIHAIESMGAKRIEEASDSWYDTYQVDLENGPKR